MAHAYQFLADVFEELNDDCSYKAWAAYFETGLKRLGAGTFGLELGCGSGAFSRALSKAGYAMDGADISEEMLSKADYLAREEGLSVRFFYADANSFRVQKPYDFILSPNDCYNYISQKKLKTAFSSAARALKKGGLFWFDLSSAYKLREQIANNVFADDRDDVTYLCFNTQKSDCVEMNVTLFIRRPDGAFDRFDETHIQYIHEEQDVASALTEAGFEILAVEGHLGADKQNSERLNFICRKK